MWALGCRAALVSRACVGWRSIGYGQEGERWRTPHSAGQFRVRSWPSATSTHLPCFAWRSGCRCCGAQTQAFRLGQGCSCGLRARRRHHCVDKLPRAFSDRQNSRQDRWEGGAGERALPRCAAMGGGGGDARRHNLAQCAEDPCHRAVSNGNARYISRGRLAHLARLRREQRQWPRGGG